MIPTPERTLLSRLRWPIVGVVVAALGGYAYLRATAPKPVSVTQARAGAAERVLAITGRTRPQVTVTIVPKTAGQIVQLTKEEGQSVRKGELLAQIEADAQRAGVDQVESAIASQQRTLVEAQRNYDRAALLRERGLNTIKDYDQAKFDLDRARTELARLTATRREASARLADATIVAPVSGVVLARPVDRGQVVNAQSVIYEIAPLADVEVEADVDERFLGEVREGMKAQVIVAGRQGALPASLEYISPKVDPRTGGAKVRFRFDAPVDGLRSGLTADVNLLVEQRSAAITVPRASILGRDERASVLVVRAGRVEQQPIRFVEWPSDRVIVTDGLQAGEQLLVQPQPALIGQAVTPQDGSARGGRPGARPAGSSPALASNDSSRRGSRAL